MQIQRPLLSIGRRVRFRHVQRVLDQSGIAPARVLDAGCGDGRLAIAVARRWPAARVVAIDSDAETIARAARRAGDGRIEWLCTEIDSAPLTGTFDLIVSTDVLEHIPDDGKTLTWLRERLAASGRLVLHVPASPQRHLFRSLDQAMAHEVALGKGPHVREGYSQDQLAAVVSTAGLRVESLGSTFYVPVVRWAADIEAWAFLKRRRWLKLLCLPALLLAAAAERQPSSTRAGHGLLLVASPAEPDVD